MKRWMMYLAVYALFALLIIAPLGALVVECLKMGGQHFIDEITLPEALFAFQISMGIAAVVVLVNSVVGLVLALVLRDNFLGRGMVNALVEMPFAISPVVAGLMLVLFYGPDTLMGLFLGYLDVKVVYALPGIVVATLFVTLPLVVREVLPVLEQRGREEEEAAYTLGASRIKAFFTITLPALRWSLGYGMVMTLARSLGEFGAVLVVSGNIIMQTQTSTLYAYQAVADFNLNGAYAASMVLIIVSFIFLLLMQVLEKRREGNRI